MKIKIRSEKVRFSLSIPVRFVGWAIKRVPDAAFIKMQSRVTPPYNQLMTRQNARMLVEECVDVLKENKGLEVVHVEASDGTFVSIKL